MLLKNLLNVKKKKKIKKKKKKILKLKIQLINKFIN